MAGYTRQSASSIQNTLDITAAPLNAEFNQVETAFGTSGHTHTGVAGDSAKIPLATSVTGYLPAANGGVGGLNKLDATSDPTVNDDTDLGYAVGSVWINVTTDRMHVCADATDGAAVWQALAHITVADGALVPDTTNTKDIGTTNNRWQDLFLSGNASVAGAITGDSATVTNAVSAASYVTTSDYRYKTIDGYIEDATGIVDSVDPIMGKRETDTKSRAMFIAHELQEVLPFAVCGEKDATDNDGNPIYQKVDYTSLIPILWAALQEANYRIERLENIT
jgi:hypothetical protein